MRHQVETIADELPTMEEQPKAIGGERGMLTGSVTDNTMRISSSSHSRLFTIIIALFLTHFYK